MITLWLHPRLGAVALAADWSSNTAVTEPSRVFAHEEPADPVERVRPTWFGPVTQ